MTSIEDRLAKLEAAVFPEKVAPRLISLKDWDAKRWEAHEKSNQPGPRRNGIACPKCSMELYDSNPHIAMMSYTPQKAIHCEACDFRGSRIA